MDSILFFFLTGFTGFKFFLPAANPFGRRPLYPDDLAESPPLVG
jgi:hypothetical protein